MALENWVWVDDLRLTRELWVGDDNGGNGEEVRLNMVSVVEVV